MPGVLKPGRSLIVVETHIYAVAADASEQICAAALATMVPVPVQPPAHRDSLDGHTGDFHRGHAPVAGQRAAGGEGDAADPRSPLHHAGIR